MQGQAQAAQLEKEVQHLRTEVDRLRSELTQERSSKDQQLSRFTALEQQLQQKTSSLVTVQSLHLVFWHLQSSLATAQDYSKHQAHTLVMRELSKSSMVCP